MPIKLVECKDWTVPGQAGKLLIYLKHRNGKEPEVGGKFSALLWVEEERRRPPRGTGRMS